MVLQDKKYSLNKRHIKHYKFLRRTRVDLFGRISTNVKYNKYFCNNISQIYNYRTLIKTIPQRRQKISSTLKYLTFFLNVFNAQQKDFKNVSLNSNVSKVVYQTKIKLTQYLDNSYNGESTSSLVREKRVILPKEEFNFDLGVHKNFKFVARQSRFFVNLLAKRRLRRFYSNINDKQIKRLFRKAKTYKINLNNKLFELFETRLDSVLVRANFALSHAHARQLINHGFVSINGKIVKSPSCTVKIMDSIAIVEKRRSMVRSILKKRLESNMPMVLAPFLEINYLLMSLKMLYKPTPEELSFVDVLDMQQVYKFFMVDKKFI